MKKIFTLAAAVIASMAMMAQTTIFSAAPATSSQIKQNAAGVYEFTSAQATVTGGHMFMAHNDGTSARKYTDKQSNQAVFSLDGSKSWFTIKLDAALQEGDTIIVEALTNGAGETNARGVWVALGSVVVRPSEAPACALLAQSETGKEFVAAKHIIQSTDDICGKDSISIWRATGNSTYFKSITIVRPEQREVDHVDVTLAGVAVNDVALSDLQMATLFGAKSLELNDSYVEAPTVTFTVQTDTYYVGETEPSTKSEKIDVVAALNPDGNWQAQQTVGEQTYTITAVKPATVTITYKDGETVLGTEVVAQGDPSAKHADFETQTLATFEGWFEDAELTVPADLTAAVNEDLTLYAKFVKAYISANVNIEQLVLDNGTSYDIQSALTAAGWDYANLNSLDTLNDLENKTNRNYDFLGLKMKTAGAYIQGWIPADGGVVIKFGNLGSDIKVTVTGATTNAEQTFAKADLWDEDEQVYVLPIYGYTEEVLVKISTVTGSTVVLKQLMLLNEGIQEVTLPAPGAYLITIAESENGTVTANWDNKKYRTPVGATVTLTFTPAENHIVMSCTVNGNEIHQSAPGAAITFEMPAEDVNIVTTFSIPTAIDNAEAAVKAEKVIRDGQVLILRDGKIFNALGAEVK